MSKRKRDRKSVAGTAAAADGGREPGRFSARRKMETSLRLLRGELLDSVARELGVCCSYPRGPLVSRRGESRDCLWVPIVRNQRSLPRAGHRRAAPGSLVAQRQGKEGRDGREERRRVR